MKLSRRSLALLALAAPSQAQPPAPLDQARKELELTAELLRKHEIPMSTEPAFLFKA
jgi:hypothetical protein